MPIGVATVAVVAVLLLARGRDPCCTESITEDRSEVKVAPLGPGAETDIFMRLLDGVWSEVTVIEEGRLITPPE